MTLYQCTLKNGASSTIVCGEYVTPAKPLTWVTGVAVKACVSEKFHCALRALFPEFHQLLLCPSIQKIRKVAPQHCAQGTHRLAHSNWWAFGNGPYNEANDKSQTCAHLPSDEGQPKHGGREPLAMPEEYY